MRFVKGCFGPQVSWAQTLMQTHLEVELDFKINFLWAPFFLSFLKMKIYKVLWRVVESSTNDLILGNC